jgi:hypothetical protein
LFLENLNSRGNSERRVYRQHLTKVVMMNLLIAKNHLLIRISIITLIRFLIFSSYKCALYMFKFNFHLWFTFIYFMTLCNFFVALEKLYWALQNFFDMWKLKVVIIGHVFNVQPISDSKNLKANLWSLWKEMQQKHFTSKFNTSMIFMLCSVMIQFKNDLGVFVHIDFCLIKMAMILSKWL